VRRGALCRISETVRTQVSFGLTIRLYGTLSGTVTEPGVLLKKNHDLARSQSQIGLKRAGSRKNGTHGAPQNHQVQKE
jgi:hypothetical protein